jgi:hypothetical protein
MPIRRAGDMRVQVNDSLLVDDFVDFLWRSGFIAERDGVETVRVSVAFSHARGRKAEDMDVFLTVWLKVAVRVWNDLWPCAVAVLLAERESAFRAA